jgi:hypothetical protein
MSLPAHVEAEVQRILDAEARRLLAHKLDAEPIRATTGTDHDLADHSADQGATGIDGEAVPVRRGVDDDVGGVDP